MAGFVVSGFVGDQAQSHLMGAYSLESADAKSGRSVYTCTNGNFLFFTTSDNCWNISTKLEGNVAM
jgi:hypothetical protein